MSEYCPYCNSIHSLLLGNVYCSRQHTPMDTLDTGTLFIKTRCLEETSDHVSRLSIRCTLNGEQRYKVGNNEHLVTSQNYLVVNQGQHYKTAFKNSEEQEMILVAYKPGVAEQLLFALQTSQEHLLDNPFNESEPVNFFERTYPQDAGIHALFIKLRQLLDMEISFRKQVDIESIYDALLVRLFQIHINIRAEVDRLCFVNKSTRTEISRRLYIARDYLDANTDKQIRMEDAAKAACLSVHHFKRTFRDLFGITPHRYLVSKRLERAKALAITNLYTVREICTKVGFENPSSFIRLFKAHTGTTPMLYRQ